MRILSYALLFPQIYNGWEQITSNPMYGRECFNLEPIQDHSPEMGPMIGYVGPIFISSYPIIFLIDRYAVTVRIRPGVVPGTEPAPSHAGMWDFMGSLPADLPKIIVVEDLTKPVIYGSMWGEVTIGTCNLKPVRGNVSVRNTYI